MPHDLHHCPVCQCLPEALELHASVLEIHLRVHAQALADPGGWMAQWVRADPQVWLACLQPRDHVEKRMSQLEALSQIDRFVCDPEARLWLDLALRCWGEGLPRILNAQVREQSSLGDEMPDRAEVELLMRRLEGGQQQERIGVAAALQDRFMSSAPVAHEVLCELVLSVWHWLPAPGEAGFLSLDAHHAGSLNALWQSSAIRLLYTRVMSFSPALKSRLLPWIAAALLPSPKSHPRLDAEGYQLLVEATCWPDDARLVWLAGQWSAFPGPVASRLNEIVLERETGVAEGRGEGARRL